MTEEQEYEGPPMTRREALQGGSAAAVAAGAFLMQKQLVGAASAQTTEPRIKLGPDYNIDDDSGNIKISHDTAGTILEYDPTADEIITLKPVQELSVTNETFILMRRSSNSSLTSANTKINIFDSEDVDVRGEFNSSGQFSPDETGRYKVVVNIDMRGNTSSGDTLYARVWNETDSVAEFNSFKTAIGSANPFSIVFPALTYDSSKTYEFQATNQTSSFTIRGNINTQGSVERVLIQ